MVQQVSQAAPGPASCAGIYRDVDKSAAASGARHDKSGPHSRRGDVLGCRYSAPDSSQGTRAVTSPCAATNKALCKFVWSGITSWLSMNQKPFLW